MEALGLQCPQCQRVQSVVQRDVSQGLYSRVVLVDGESSPLRTAFLEALDQLGLRIDRVVPAGTLPEAVEPFRGPDPEGWSAPHIQLSDSSIHVADGPQDVGTLVAGIVKQSEVERTSDLTLVCPDADLEASLQSILPELGVPARVSNAGLQLDGALVVSCTPLWLFLEEVGQKLKMLCEFLDLPALFKLKSESMRTLTEVAVCVSAFILKMTKWAAERTHRNQ